MSRELDYRESHAATAYGDLYNKMYGAGYYRAQWELVERPLLEEIVGELGGEEKRCLDFACGTGRITRTLAAHFGTVVGVDVSREMLSASVAKGLANVELKEIDITRAALDEQFDVVTAFRFFLNAQESLRADVARALFRALKPEGALICNTHMKNTSPMGAAYAALHVITGRAHKTLSVKHLCTILASAGFRISEIRHYSFLPRPGPLLGRACEQLLLPVERIAEQLHLPGSLSQCAIVVAAKP